jgi:hypothetical protein
VTDNESDMVRIRFVIGDTTYYSTRTSPSEAMAAVDCIKGRVDGPRSGCPHR